MCRHMGRCSECYRGTQCVDTWTKPGQYSECCRGTQCVDTWAGAVSVIGVHSV